VPAEVIAELEKADIDPAAKRHQKVVEMAQQLNADGQSAAMAVEGAREARAKAPRRVGVGNRNYRIALTGASGSKVRSPGSNCMVDAGDGFDGAGMWAV